LGGASRPRSGLELTKKRKIEQGGTGKGRYYTLAREIYTLMKSSINYDKDKILDRESVKLKILSILKDRRLTNRDIRQITGYDRQQVIRLMRELEIEGVKITGRGMGAYYSLNRD
jgi:ATP-dependent DNA helicase RecG